MSIPIPITRAPIRRPSVLDLSGERLMETIVARHFGILAKQVKVKRKFSYILWPRWTCMYLMREEWRWSYGSIGHYFGKDHGTVIHAHKQVEKRMEVDHSFRRVVETLRQEVQQ